jgi:hypothetical protein
MLPERDALDKTTGFDSGVGERTGVPAKVATMESGITDPQDEQDRLSLGSSAEQDGQRISFLKIVLCRARGQRHAPYHCRSVPKQVSKIRYAGIFL